MCGALCSGLWWETQPGAQPSLPGAPYGPGQRRAPSQPSLLPRVSLGLAGSERAPHSSLWSQAACPALGTPGSWACPQARGLQVAQAFGRARTSPQLTCSESTGTASLSGQAGVSHRQAQPWAPARLPAILAVCSPAWPQHELPDDWPLCQPCQALLCG